MSGSTVEAPQGTHKAVFSNAKTLVIGIFGIEGSGKHSLLQNLKNRLSEVEWVFYDSSELIKDFGPPGGLDAFNNLSEDGKKLYRVLATKRLKKDCAKSGKNGLVVRHYMSWDENQTTSTVLCLQDEIEAFTNILYLNTSVETITEGIKDDSKRQRTMTRLHRWQEEERERLQSRCLQSNIPVKIVLVPDVRVLAIIEAIQNEN